MSSTNRVRRNFMLSQPVIDKIDSLSNKSNLTKSNIVERAINYYIENEGRDYKGLYEVLNSMFNHIEEKIDKNTHSINAVKKDTNVILEVKNNELLNNGNGNITLISEKESEEIEKIRKEQEKILQSKRTKKLEG